MCLSLIYPKYNGVQGLLNDNAGQANAAPLQSRAGLKYSFLAVWGKHIELRTWKISKDEMNLPWEYCSVVKTFHQSSSFILESLFLQHFGNKTSSNQPSLKKIKKSNYSFSHWTFLNFYKYSISLMLNTSSKLQFLMISCDCDTRGCWGVLGMKSWEYLPHVPHSPQYLLSCLTISRWLLQETTTDTSNTTLLPTIY